MYRVMTGLLVTSLLVVAVYVGCEARSQVAMDNITKRIDKMLGELDVKRKKIDNEVKSLESAMQNIREKRISAKVQLEGYQEKAKLAEKEINDIKKAMAKVQPHVGSEESVTIAKKEYSPAEVTATANKLIAEFESQTKKLGGLENSLQAFERAHNLLLANENQGKETMKSLKSKLDEIDTKKEAAMAMKTAGGLAGDESMSDRFAELEKSVDGLFTDVETAMRVEEEKIAERQRDLESQSNTVSDILEDLDTSDEASARLKEILGGSGEGDGGTSNDG